MSQQLTEEQARKQVKKLRDFYSHVTSYLIVNGGLFALNMATSPGHMWFIYPAIGWGIGLAFNAMAVFQFFGAGKDWEERRVRELMAAQEEYVSASKLYNILDERISTLNTPAGASADQRTLLALQARIEKLEKRLLQLEPPSQKEVKADTPAVKDARLEGIILPDDYDSSPEPSTTSRTAAERSSSKN
jgi:hypothetical protein